MALAPSSPTFTAPGPEAVKRLPRALAFRHDVLPLAFADGVLTVAVADAADTATLDLVRAAARLRLRVVPMARAVIREHLRLAYGEPPALEREADGAPAVRAVDSLIERAAALHASDIHLEPGRRCGRARLRVDGILRDGGTFPSDLFAAMISRVKVLAAMDIADRRQPQDGRCSLAVAERTIDARVATVPTPDGEKAVIRLLDHDAEPPDLAQLGMDSAVFARYRAAVRAPWGFVVVAGPTGSGKTTTLYASLAQLDAASTNICSVEDPIELRLSGITQVQVNPRAGVSFASATRAFVRQDPNAIMVGELRDAETAAVALSAALAGQIVFTTLHANDAPRSIDRLLELGVTRHSLAAALTAVAAQRLVRSLCERCRAREPVPAALAAELPEPMTSWHVARGCRACDGTGYLGRTGVYELLAVDDAVRDAIAGGASSVRVAELATRCGYRPMLAAALAKVRDGTTSFDELRRVVNWQQPA